MKKIKDETAALIKRNSKGINLDIGCGAAKQSGFVGMDVRPLPGVDIVHNLELFPWPLPDECTSFAIASHLVEHINPTAGDARIKPLIDLLLKKRILTKKEIFDVIGNHDAGPIFIAFMDEVWRIMKPGGQFMFALPYGGSRGFWQDPTHINGCNEATWAYFDPLEAGGFLYKIYKPRPWKIISSGYSTVGNMEVVLEKRKEDPSYYA